MIKKIGLLITLVSVFIVGLCVPTYAKSNYTLDSNGNLVSDNKIDFNLCYSTNDNYCSIYYDDIYPCGFEFKTNNNTNIGQFIIKLLNGNTELYVWTYDTLGYDFINNIFSGYTAEQLKNYRLYFYRNGNLSDYGFYFDLSNLDLTSTLYSFSFNCYSFNFNNNNTSTIINDVMLVNYSISDYVEFVPYGVIYYGSQNVSEKMNDFYQSFYTSNIKDLVVLDSIELYYDRGNYNIVKVGSYPGDNVTGNISISYDNNGYYKIHLSNLSIGNFYYFSFKLNAFYLFKDFYINDFLGDSASVLFLNETVYFTSYTYDNSIKYFYPPLQAQKYDTIGIGGIDSVVSNIDIYFNANILFSNNDEASYTKGYVQAQKDYEKNINTLKDEIKQLQEQVNNSFGWKNFAFAMVDLPFLSVQKLLGFEVFGLNMFLALTGIITVLCIIWIIKKLFK